MCVSCCYSLNLFLLLISDLNILSLRRVSAYVWQGHFTSVVKNLYLFLGAYETVPFYDFEGSNTEVTEKLEELVTIWIKQLKQVIVESEQMRREADDIGPSAELEYWKTRMSSFNRWNPCILSHSVKKNLIKSIFFFLKKVNFNSKERIKCVSFFKAF